MASAKRSAAYRAIRARVAAPTPGDSWYEGGLACLTFALRPASGEAEMSQAIFVLSLVGQVLAARIVETGADGSDTVHDLLTGDAVSTIGEDTPV